MCLKPAGLVPVFFKLVVLFSGKSWIYIAIYSLPALALHIGKQFQYICTNDTRGIYTIYS